MDLNQFQSTPATFVTDIESLNDNSIVCRIKSVNQMITTVKQSIDQLQQCIPSNNSVDELTKTIIQYQQSQKDLQQENERLQQLQADQQRLENQIAEYQVQRNSIQTQIEAIAQTIEDETERLDTIVQRCDHDISLITRNDLDEIIALRNPPQALVKVLQAIRVLQRTSNQRDLEWSQLQYGLSDPYFLYIFQIRFWSSNQINIANQAQQLISDVTYEITQSQSRAGPIFFQWIHAASNRIRGFVPIEAMEQQQYKLQQRLQQVIEQEETVQQQLIINSEQQQITNENISQQQKWLTENNLQFLQCQFSEQADKCLKQIQNSQNTLCKFIEIWPKMTPDDQILVRFIDLSLRLHPTIINQQTKLYEILLTLQPFDNELIFSKKDQIKQQLQSLMDFQNDANYKIRFVKLLPLIAAHTFNLLQEMVNDSTIRNTFFEQIYSIYSTIIQNNQFPHSIQYILGFISEVQLVLYKEFPSYYYDLGNVKLQDNLSIIDYLIKKVKQPQELSRLFQAAQFVELNQSGRVYKEYQLVRFAKEMDIQYNLKEQTKIEQQKLIGQMYALEHKLQSHMKRISNLPQTEENQRILITQLSNCQASIDDLEGQLVETTAKLDKITLEIQQTQTKLKKGQGLGSLEFPIKRSDISYISSIQMPSDTTYSICIQLMVLLGKPTEWDNIRRNIQSYFKQIVKMQYENINDEMIEIIKKIRTRCSPIKKRETILNQIDYWLDNVVKNYEIYSQLDRFSTQLELDTETSQSLQLTISDLNEQLNLKKTEQASLNEINSKLQIKIAKHQQLQTCYQTNSNHANRVLQQIELNRKQAEYNQQYIEEFNNFQVIQQLFEYTSFDWRTILADTYQFVHPDLIQHINQSIKPETTKNEQTQPAIVYNNKEISKLDIEQLDQDLRRKEIKMYLIKAWFGEYSKLEDQFINLFKGEEQQSLLVKLSQQSYFQHQYDSFENNKLIMLIVEVIIILWKNSLVQEVAAVQTDVEINNREILLKYVNEEIEYILQTYFKKGEDNTLNSLEFMSSILKVLNQDPDIKIQIAYQITLQLFKINKPDIEHNIEQSILSINQAIQEYFKFEQMLD